MLIVIVLPIIILVALYTLKGAIIAIGGRAIHLEREMKKEVKKFKQKMKQKRLKLKHYKEQ